MNFIASAFQAMTSSLLRGALFSCSYKIDATQSMLCCRVNIVESAVKAVALQGEYKLTLCDFMLALMNYQGDLTSV